MFVLNMNAICIYMCIIYVCGCQKKHTKTKYMRIDVMILFLVE